MVKNVKEIKELIKEHILPGYSLKTNFSATDALVEIGDGLIIMTEPIIEGDEVIYKFMLDTQFVKYAKITFEEIVMAEKVISILEDNRKFVLSKFRKYTKEEFLEEERIREEKSKKMMKELEQAILIMHLRNQGIDI